MVQISEEQIARIGSVLNDPNRPLKERFRALFTLKNIGGTSCIECIKSAFSDSSALLKHELAYCLGQMQDKQAVPILVEVLEDTTQEAMVRHEAGEALGAIADPSIKALLEKYKQDPIKEVAETCELALDRIEWLKESASEKSLYNTVDPAPPCWTTNLDALNDIIKDERTRSLFERYRAMFSLRDSQDKKAAVEILGQALLCGSALFKHEVAFVLGQLQEESSVPYLEKSLADESENEMVRHECAEALGAIATKDCYEILKKYLNDEKRVVRESCEIALDMCEYENSPEFQYANTLQAVS